MHIHIKIKKNINNLFTVVKKTDSTIKFTLKVDHKIDTQDLHPEGIRTLPIDYK